MPTDNSQPTPAPQTPTQAPSTPMDYSQATLNPQFQDKAPQIKSTIVQLRNQGVADDKIFSYLQQKGVMQVPQTKAPEAKPSYLEQVGKNLSDTFSQGGKAVSSDIANTQQGKGLGVGGVSESVLGNLATAGHVAGDIAGTAGNLIGSFITPLLPESVKQGIGDVSKFVSDKINAIPGMTPEIAKGLGDVFNTLTLKGSEGVSPTVEGTAKGAINALESGAQKVINTGDIIGQKVGLVPKSTESVSASSLKDALDVVSPKMSAKDTAEALAQGRGQGGGLLSKTTITPDKLTTDTAQAVQGIVKKGAPASKNIANIRQALSTEAENLKSQIKSVDHPYSFRELSAKLNSIESPISIKGTAFEKQIGAVKKAAIQIAKENGGNISSLLDARKAFDALVSKEYPNLYDSASAPMKNAITSIRNGMNDFIEQNLPDNMSFKDSLTKQSMYYRAIDNIAEKAVEETKTTGIGRLGKTLKQHPIGSTVVGAVGGETAHKIITGSF